MLGAERWSALFASERCEQACDWLEPAKRVLSKFDSGMIKVIWVTAQILSSIRWNVSIEFPEPFSTFLNIISFTRLDFNSV